MTAEGAENYTFMLQDSMRELRALLSATATLNQFGCIFYQFTGIQSFGNKRFAQHHHQSTFCTVLDTGHKEHFLIAIAFTLDLEGQVFDGIYIRLTAEDLRGGRGCVKASLMAEL